LKVDFEKYTYEPILYMSDFWNLKKHMVGMNETVQTLNLTLNF
jgi:hypothetical protein